MSTDAVDQELAEGGPEQARGHRLQYLLKVAQRRLSELTGPALAPHGIDLRELAVLAPLAGAEPLSQQELSGRLGIDRTTMVGLVDRLEAKGLVARRAHPADRRKNVVELTAAGRATLREATSAVDEAERRFLAPLPEGEAAQLRAALTALTSEAPPRPVRRDAPGGG